MKTEVKKLDSTKTEISIEVSGDIVKAKFEDVFKRIAKDAKIPGFRPGHAPRDLLEKHYAHYAHELVLKELVPDIYEQAIRKEGLEVIELPNLSDVKLDRSMLSFKAQVEVTPSIPLKNYKGLKVTYKKIEVSPDEIKRNIDSLIPRRKSPGLGPGMNEDLFKEGGSPGLQAERAPQETRKIDPVRNTESIGEENKVSSGVDVIDDNFAKGLGYPNPAELEKAMEKQIYIHKENLQRQKIENGIIENILAGLDFKLPQSLVNRQLQDLLRQTKLDLALKGVPREKIAEQEKALLQELEPRAREQVKVYLVLSQIAKKENIPQDDHMPHQVMEFLLREADWKESF